MGYDFKKLVWQDELNPRVRCAFGNVLYLLPSRFTNGGWSSLISTRTTTVTMIECELKTLCRYDYFHCAKVGQTVLFSCSVEVGKRLKTNIYAALNKTTLLSLISPL